MMWQYSEQYSLEYFDRLENRIKETVFPRNEMPLNYPIISSARQDKTRQDKTGVSYRDINRNKISYNGLVYQITLYYIIL